MYRYLKYIITLFVACNIQIVLTDSSVYSQNSYWIQTAGGSAADEGTDISIDANGNTYTTGYFSGTIQFGSNISLTSSGVTDIFIVKIDNQGNYLLAIKAGGAGPDRGTAIKTDVQGNILVTGYFYGTATFGSTTITANGNSQDIFIAKYNSSGLLQWVISEGGSAGDIGNGITTDLTGNVIVTGQFQGTAQFSSFSLTSMIDPNTSLFSFDIFTAKYDANGNILWVKQGTAPYNDRGLDIASDNSGSVFVTGQFSDTIAFDVTHYNNMYNAIFLIKYDSNGVEQWFRRIGGTTLSIAYGITVDDTANIYLTGDFVGSLYFFVSETPNYTLTNSYPNNIFIAKYKNNGDLTWAEADGSDSEVSSRNIALDDSANVYVVGNFKCKFSDYADQYGQGTFNSIGYQDVFTAKYNTNGVRQWMRNFGGQRDDYGNGIAVDNSGKVYHTGSFNEKIILPVSANFPNLDYTNDVDIYPAFGGTYCNDNKYTSFYSKLSVGNSDIFILKAIDLSREPYDFYKRSGSGCNRNFVAGCINNVAYDNSCSNDSIEVCGSVSLFAASNTSSHYESTSPGADSPGPYFNYLWSTSAVSRFVSVNSTGYYSVTITTIDGCFSSSDTVFVQVNPVPDVPTISDNKGVNNNAIYTQPVVVCNDSVVLTGGNVGTNIYYWQDDLGNIDSTMSITASTTGIYYFYVINSFGCLKFNYVGVTIQSGLPPIVPKIILKSNDTICKDFYFDIAIYDSITNDNCIDYSTTSWSVNPSITQYSGCESSKLFYPPQSGTYQIDAVLIRQNLCGNDTFYFSKAFDITVLPRPIVNITISGDIALCPGDTTILTATGGTSYEWSGPGIVGNPYQASIKVQKAGYYGVYSDTTDAFGCWASDNAGVNVTLKPLPTITMTPPNGIVCPNDSVLLTTTATGSYQWYTPSGLKGGNTSSIYVNTAGFYYCVVTDVDSCVVISNTVEVKEYTTPYLIAVPFSVLCTGTSITIQAITNDGSTLQWQPPLSGGNLIQTVSSAGFYTCNITSCGIQTNASINITNSNVFAQITASGPTNFCSGDSVILTANGFMANYRWTPGDSFTQSIVVKQSETYTVTTRDAYGCSAVSQPITIYVYFIAPPVVADTNICVGSSATLTASATGIIEWFASASGGTPIATGTTFISPVLNADTTFYVQTKDTVCSSLRIPVNVHIIPASMLPQISSNSPLCEGDTILFSSNFINNATYQWNGPNSFSSNLQNPIIVNATSSYSGNYILVTIADGCTSATANISVLVNSTPSSPILSSNSPICEGETLVLNSTTIPNVTYYWFGANNFSSTLQNPMKPDVNIADSGFYSLVVESNGCLSDTVNIFITINVTPKDINPAYNNPICESDTLFLTTNLIPSATYSWIGPNLFTSSSQNPIVPNVSLFNSGAYSIFIEVNGCLSKTKTINVVVNDYPNVNLGVDTMICNGVTMILNADQPNVTFLWQDKSTYPSYSVTNFGTYFVEVNKAGCIKSDTITIKLSDCSFRIPNILTPYPASAGVNDIFYITGLNNDSQLKVYNRWGKMVYNSYPYQNNWDGSEWGTFFLVSGTYYYILIDRKKQKSYTGFVYIFRE